jgi:hypothetical protein
MKQSVVAMHISGDMGTYMYLNPYNTSLTIELNDPTLGDIFELRMYDVLGVDVLNRTLTEQITVLETNILPFGVYLFNVIGNGRIIQAGKLISNQ